VIVHQIREAAFLAWPFLFHGCLDEFSAGISCAQETKKYLLSSLNWFRGEPSLCYARKAKSISRFFWNILGI
jgi:hypothetical protein